MNEPEWEIDLEQWRIKQGLSYEGLARALGLTDAKLARAYALGARMAPQDVMDTIKAVTEGRVGVLAMHLRRAGWLKRAEAELLHRMAL